MCDASEMIAVRIHMSVGSWSRKYSLTRLSGHDMVAIWSGEPPSDALWPGDLALTTTHKPYPPSSYATSQRSQEMWKGSSETNQRPISWLAASHGPDNQPSVNMQTTQK